MTVTIRALLVGDAVIPSWASEGYTPADGSLVIVAGPGGMEVYPYDPEKHTVGEYRETAA